MDDCLNRLSQAVIITRHFPLSPRVALIVCKFVTFENRALTYYGGTWEQSNLGRSLRFDHGAAAPMQQGSGRLMFLSVGFLVGADRPTDGRNQISGNAEILGRITSYAIFGRKFPVYSSASVDYTCCDCAFFSR